MRLAAHGRSDFRSAGLSVEHGWHKLGSDDALLCSDSGEKAHSGVLNSRGGVTPSRNDGQTPNKMRAGRAAHGPKTMPQKVLERMPAKFPPDAQAGARELRNYSEQFRPAAQAASRDFRAVRTHGHGDVAQVLPS